MEWIRKGHFAISRRGRYDDFIALKSFACAILEEDLKRSADAKYLQFTVNLALLARDAVHDTGYVAEMHLELTFQLKLIFPPSGFVTY